MALISTLAVSRLTLLLQEDKGESESPAPLAKVSQLIQKCHWSLMLGDCNGWYPVHVSVVSTHKLEKKSRNIK